MKRSFQGALADVIRYPIVSEKTTSSSEKQNTHVFEVARDADKLVIRRAVEKLFSVKVDEVRIVNVRGKQVRSRTTRRLVGRRRARKKAYVKLAEGQDINFTEAS